MVNKIANSIQLDWLFRILTLAFLKKSKCFYQIEDFLSDSKAKQFYKVYGKF